MTMTKTLRDPEVQGNNEKPGRFNLKGQQKPEYLIEAENIEQAAWSRMMDAVEKHENEQTDSSLINMQVANNLYSETWKQLQSMQKLWEKEQGYVQS